MESSNPRILIVLAQSRSANDGMVSHLPSPFIGSWPVPVSHHHQNPLQLQRNSGQLRHKPDLCTVDTWRAARSNGILRIARYQWFRIQSTPGRMLKWNTLGNLFPWPNCLIWHGSYSTVHLKSHPWKHPGARCVDRSAVVRRRANPSQ
jgi:hypothetical protein